MGIMTFRQDADLISPINPILLMKCAHGAQNLRRKNLILSRARHPEVGALLQQIAGRLKFGDCDEKIANVDGAVWIPEQIESGGLDVDGLGLDFYT